MKVVILAGGFGTRISEESQNKPKPMVDIGGKPVLWHIMKTYSHYGYNDFVICCGYKQHVIKEYFADYFLYTSDITFDFRNNGEMTVHNNQSEPWKVTLVDTGLYTMTGGRIKRIQKYIGDEPFMLTYGDGVADIDIEKLVDFHKKGGHLATLSAVDIGQRFGMLGIDGENKVKSFREKSVDDSSRVNGGYMVLEPKVFDYIDGDETVFEQEPLENLAKDGELDAYIHNGFWKPMDTLREKKQLDEMWDNNKAPWKVW